MTEFNKEQYFEDMDAALRANDPKLADNDNATLIEELSEQEQLNLVDEMSAYLSESNDKEENENVTDMVKYLNTLSASYKLKKMLEEEDSASGVAEDTAEGTQKELATDTSAEDTAEAVESEGNASAQEAEEGKSEA